MKSGLFGLALLGLAVSATAQVRRAPPAMHGGAVNPHRGGVVNPPVGPIIRPPAPPIVPGLGRPSHPIVPPRFNSFPQRPVRPFVPFYSYPYFPYASTLSPYYYEPPPVPAPSTAVPDYQQINNDMTIQIQQLNDELRQLRSDMSQVRTIQVPQHEVMPASAAPAAPPIPIALIFRNGDQIEANGYAITGSKLWVIKNGSSMEFPLSDLDQAATRAENLKRGANFRSP